MICFLANFHFIVSIVSAQLSSFHFYPVYIDGTKGSFLISAKNSPRLSFVVSSFSNESNIEYINSEWIRDYQDYSIENYIQGKKELFINLESNQQNLSLSVTLCSFQEKISEKAEIFIEYNKNFNECSSHGYLENGRCLCYDNFIGADCSLQYEKVFFNSSEKFKIEAYSIKIFSTEVIKESVQIEIDSSKMYLQSFYWVNNSESSLTLPSFLSKNNSVEIQEGPKHKIIFKGIKEGNILFSVFCYGEEPCEFELKLKKTSGKKKKHKDNEMLILITVLCFMIPIVLSCIFLIVLKKFKCCQFGLDNVNSTGKHPQTYAIAISLPDNLRNEECAICYENYKELNEATKVGCGHFFHSQCIDDWALVNSECPLCRVQFTKSRSN